MSSYTHSDLSLVRTFEAVALLKSFSDAAQHLNISQSTASEHVRLLEEKVGVKLLNRTTRQVSLTKAGEDMRVYAQSLLRVSDQIAAHFGAFTPTKLFRLGLAEDIAFSRFSCLLRLFAGCFPDLVLSIRTGTTGDLVHMLESDALDMIVGKRRVGGQGGRVMWRNPTIWVAHEQIRIPWEQAVPLLVIQAPSVLRSIALEALGEHGRSYRILLESNSFTGLRAAFEFGQGITVGLADYLPDFVRPLDHDQSLPTLPPVEIFVQHRDEIPSPAHAFAALVEDALVRLHSPSDGGVPDATV